MGGVKFAHGDMMVWGMYLAFVLATRAGVDPYLAFAACAAALFVLGFAVQRALVDRILDAPHEMQILLMLGVALVLENVALVVFGPEPTRVRSALSTATIWLGPGFLDVARLVTFGVAIVLSWALFLCLVRTDLGRTSRRASSAGAHREVARRPRGPGAARAAGRAELLRRDDLHPHLLLRLPRPGLERGRRLRGPALRGPRGLRRGRRLHRGDALDREGADAVARHVRRRRARGPPRRRDRLPRLPLRPARVLLRAPHGGLRGDLPHRRLEHRRPRRRARPLHHVHRRSAPVPVPGQPRLLLHRARADARGDRDRRAPRAAALRDLPDGDPRGRGRVRGARRRHAQVQAPRHDPLLVPHRDRRDLLRVLPLLAPARDDVRHPALRRDHPAAHRRRRRDAPRPAPRLVHPDAPRRAVAPLLRPERPPRAPPRGVRPAADRGRALPAAGRVSLPAAAHPGHARLTGALLEVTGLSKRFGGLQAVRDLSLPVAEREIVALIRPNGAGQTTAFPLISGFLTAAPGSIPFRGPSITGLAPHRVCALGMARTFQITRPFPRLSVLRNVMIGALGRHAEPREAEARARAVLDELGLAAKAERPAGGLTLAERKRLELAKALATEPVLLLLDEVMSGLNDAETERLVAEVRAINARGMAILLIEHVMRAVMSLASRIVVLNYGERIADGRPDEGANAPRVIQAYPGDEPA